MKPLQDHVLHELSDCPLFNLPNPLAADAEHRGDLVQRARALVRNVEGAVPRRQEVVLPVPAMSQVVSTLGVRASARGTGFDTLGNARVPRWSNGDGHERELRSLRPLLAGLSVAGAAIALATQGVLSNVAAGLTIIFTKPFRVGQYVQIVGVEGQVESITLFSTTLSHTDRSMIVIPNRKVVGEILHNYGRIRQLDVAVGVAYDTDLNSALGAIQEILRNNPRVLKDPAPFIQTTQLGNSAVVVAVKPWVSVADFGDATGEINKAIVETFRGRGIVIPYPQHEVRLLGQSG